MQDEFGNEIGVNSDNTKTFNGKTMDEYLAAGELPNGYYKDPEGAVRAEIPGFNGEVPNMGGRHAVATYVNGRITKFTSGAADYIPGQPASNVGQPYQPPADAAGAVKDQIKVYTQKIQALVQEL